MVDVLLFADLQEAVGKGELSFDAEGLSVKELKDKCLKSYGLENINYAMVAINEEYADESTILNKGDVVAFIPPVSGG